MTFYTARLTGEQAGVAWDKAGGVFLAPAIAGCNGLYLPEDVREKVTNPDTGWLLWIIGEGDLSHLEPMGAWTSEVRQFPRGRVLDVAFAGGREMERWFRVAWGEMEKFARESGCDRFRCCGRKGWAKFGLRPAGMLFERTL